jgi:hypothetical protein
MDQKKQEYYDYAQQAAAYLGEPFVEYQKRWIRVNVPIEYEIFAGCRYDNEFLEQPDHEINRIFIRYIQMCPDHVLNAFGV